MEKQHKPTGKQSPKALLIGLLITSSICLLFAGILSYRIAHHIKRDTFPVPREITIDQIESWMTIRYIARTYRVPEQLFIEKLGVTPNESRTASIAVLAKRKKITTTTLIERIKRLIIDFAPAHARPQLQTS